MVTESFDLEELKRKMERLLVDNCEKKTYIPFAALDCLLDPSVIRACIFGSGITVHRQEEVITRIIDGGKRVLALLIRLDSVPSMVQFLESDQLTGQPLDAKLPFSREQLDAIVENNGVSESFYREQWQVITPVFKADMSHRKLDNYTVLPFKSSVCVGEGAFGEVFKVELDPGSHDSSMVCYL